MDQDFRKKTFRGAKIEDVILELEKLSRLCENKVVSSGEPERQRFYEGMAIAYTTVALKLKGEFDYIEPKVIEHLYDAAQQTSFTDQGGKMAHADQCSFCRRGKAEAGKLAMGPGVSICRDCLEFGVQVMDAPN